MNPHILHDTLVSLVAHARYGYRGTKYREALDQARRLLGYHCSLCGALYQSNEVRDHATVQCHGHWKPAQE